jgi:hypothetical protein
MLKNILKAMHTEKGRYAISIILGLGIASLFRKVCSGRNCIILKAPDMEEVQKTIYAYNNKCYKFKEQSSKCGMAKKQVLIE